MSDSATPRTVARQAPLSVIFSRQEYWKRLPFPSPGDLPDRGLEPASLTSAALAGRFFTTTAILGHWRAKNRALGGVHGGCFLMRGPERSRMDDPRGVILFSEGI